MLRHLLPRAIRREWADPTPNTSKPSCAVPHRKSACWRHCYLCAGQFHRPTVNAKPGRIATRGGLLT